MHISKSNKKELEIMKQYSKKLLSLAVLCSTVTSMVHADVLPFIQWRSEGRDTARKLYGQTAYAIYQQDEDTWDGSFAATFQYDQSFRGKNIARCLFGDSLIGSVNNAGTASCNDECGDETLVIQGSQVTNKLARSWMAENFLLPRDFQSAIKFSPRVQNVLVDFDLYVGFNRWVNGMYFRLYGPVNWNKASLHAEETVIFAGTPTTSTTAVGGGYTAGYFDPQVDVATASLFNKALQFFGGCELPAYNEQSVTVQPLEFAKFSDCIIPGTNPCDSDCGNTSHRKTGFAELRGELGWNYFYKERGRFLINIQAAAPTGSRPKAEYLFPAQIGNGKHWELGVGLGGAYKFWRSEDEDHCFSFIWEADITHMFAAKQQRTFDLKGKPNSRYMLAQKITNNSFVPTATQLTNTTIAFADEYAPVANFSTRDVKVSIGVQGDVVAMFNYTVRGFSWDIGYNFWGMSTSKIKLNNCGDECEGFLPFPENTWALKGDASVAGFFETPAGDFVAVNLAATESAATIFNGTNGLVTPPVTIPATPSAFTNPNIDTPVQALVGTTALRNGGNGGPINTSATPVLISINDLDIKGAEQRGLSNKVFTHFSYTWTKCEKWLPFVGAGFSAQFGMHSGHGDDCDDDCSTPVVTTDECGKSSSCALSNWAIFVKGGVSFH